MKLRKHTSAKDEEVEINMTPMLDIVFIMLIFFIVTASFVEDSGITVNRPKAEATERIQKKNLIIGISPECEVWIEKRVVDIRALQANVERLLAENTFESAFIQADKKTPTGFLVRVMDNIRLAGIKNISIAAEAEGQ